MARQSLTLCACTSDVSSVCFEVTDSSCVAPSRLVLVWLTSTMMLCRYEMMLLMMNTV